MAESWSIINQEGHGNLEHDHGGYTLSGAYYAACGEIGESLVPTLNSVILTLILSLPLTLTRNSLLPLSLSSKTKGVCEIEFGDPRPGNRAAEALGQFSVRSNKTENGTQNIISSKVP